MCQSAAHLSADAQADALEEAQRLQSLEGSISEAAEWANVEVVELGER